MLSLRPADVVVVRTNGLAARVIRLGELLQGKPDMHNHVAVVHHITPEGTVWFLEGRPGGLGWRAERPGLDHGYLSSRWTVTNAAQPKTDQQRHGVCEAMLRMLGAPYDWGAIEADAEDALHLDMLHFPEMWQRWGNGQMPGHVVCSSAAAWAYKVEGLAAPEIGGGRFTEPGDWDEFLAARHWEQSLYPA